MVEKSITTALPQGKVRLQRVAPALGMSVRTLGRRLAASGITFAQILDGLRHDLAVTYLQDPDIPLSQVAFLLGYSEVSGFVHAFRRWTGSTPGAWRANHLA
jgi:AraC-like DNA-binding protein